MQREGLEYEFDLVGYMEEDNTFIADKSRCSFYAQKAYTKPGPKEFQPLVDWLQGGASRAPLAALAQRIDTGGHPLNTAAAQYVAEQKIAAGNPASEAEQHFQSARERVGEVIWREPVDKGKRRKLEGSTVTLSLHGCDKRAEVTDEAAVPTQYKRITVTLSAETWELVCDSLDLDLRDQVLGEVKSAKVEVATNLVKADLKADIAVPGARLAGGAAARADHRFLA